MPACNYACHTADHAVSRRAFLGAAGAAAALGPAGFASPAADSRSGKGRRSASWSSSCRAASASSKPGTRSRTPTPAGRSRRSRPPCPARTSANCCRTPRSRCTAWPWSAASTQPTTTTASAATIMHTGRKPEAGHRVPAPRRGRGAAARHRAAALPGHIQIPPKGGSGFGKQDAAFLGPKYASVSLGDGKPPANLFRPDGPDRRRRRGSRGAPQEAQRPLREVPQVGRDRGLHRVVSTQAERVVTQGDVFDVEKENPKLADRYGRHDFGRHCCSPAACSKRA